MNTTEDAQENHPQVLPWHHKAGIEIEREQIRRESVYSISQYEAAEIISRNDPSVEWRQETVRLLERCADVLTTYDDNAQYEVEQAIRAHLRTISKWEESQ
jgi:hypothetical protein